MRETLIIAILSSLISAGLLLGIASLLPEGGRGRPGNYQIQVGQGAGQPEVFWPE